MTQYNLCYSQKISCSACCGIYNIDLNQDKKKEWLLENTRNFLKLDLLNRVNVLRFRSSGEDFLKKLMIRPDVYICPFIGFTGETGNKTGCLLNSGSPHEQVKTIQAPLNFSFYGEAVCKTYDCISKQNINLSITKEENNGSSVELYSAIYNFLNEAMKHILSLELLSPFTYGKLISNHNLIGACLKIIERYSNGEEKLLVEVIKKLEKIEIPVTSFEMPLTFEFFTDQELFHVLGTLFSSEGYIFDAFKINKMGELEGNKIRAEFDI